MPLATRPWWLDEATERRLALSRIADHLELAECHLIAANERNARWARIYGRG